VNTYNPEVFICLKPNVKTYKLSPNLRVKDFEIGLSNIHHYDNTPIFLPWVTTARKSGFKKK